MYRTQARHFGQSHSFRYSIVAAVSSSLLVLFTFYLQVLGLEQTIPLLMQLSPVLFGILGFVIGHKEDLYRAAEERANRDFMTGLPNHSYFQERLRAELSRSMRYQEHDVSLIMLDLDHFKKVNDDFGHQKGDEVLSLVGKFLREVLRSSDFAARYGGEEFVVILPETKASEAIQTGERLRENIGRVAAEAGIPDGYVSASFGVADYPTSAADAEGLISAADSSLLFAKRNGRNQVVNIFTLESLALDSDGGTCTLTHL